MVLYLDRDSDAVIAGGAEADPNTERLHSGDDAIFLGGVRTGTNQITGLPSGTLCMATVDGSVYLSMTKTVTLASSRRRSSRPPSGFPCAFPSQR